MLKRTAFAIVMASLATHCSNPNTTVSCTTTTTVMTPQGMSSTVSCSENPTDNVDDARQGCMISNPDGGQSGVDGGTSITNSDKFVAGPCSHTDAVGGCKTGDNAMWFYAGWMADSVRMQCAMNGGVFLTP